jgi:(p)ppGpp synthase/HD superfamily hydrolase
LLPFTEENVVMPIEIPTWTPTLERALRLAAQGHEGQVRKGSPIPYVEHPMAVAMILDRAGFEEDVVVAGLLHDLVEDTEVSLDEIRSAFGDVVAETVAGCSEIKSDAGGRKRPWADRKRDHLEALGSANLATRAVTLADKLHNLASIAFDLDEGRPVWSTFNATRDDVLAYYRAMIATCGTGDPRLEILSQQAVTLLNSIDSDSATCRENPPTNPLPG